MAGFEKAQKDLTPLSFLKLRGIITAHISLAFLPRRNDLLQERLAAYKAEDWKTYTMKIQQAQTEYQKCSMEEIDFALKFLEFKTEDYARTVQLNMSEPTIRSQVEQSDMEIKQKINHKAVNLAREEIKLIWIEVISGDGELAKNLPPL